MCNTLFSKQILQASTMQTASRETLFYEAPFEIWRILPGNKALDLIDIIIKYDPETSIEVDFLGNFLWVHNLVGEMIACDKPHLRSTAKGCDDLFYDALSAKAAYVNFMLALHYLWFRANGGRYGQGDDSKRGLNSASFKQLLATGCASILIERRRQYNGQGGYSIIAMIKDLRKHWDFAIGSRDGFFRRAIPVDDMHTSRYHHGSIGYELQSEEGGTIHNIDHFEAFHLASDLAYNTETPKAAITFHTEREIYIEMINPVKKGLLYGSWLTKAPGVLYRPFRHRLFNLDHAGNPSTEVRTYLHHEDLGAGLGDDAKIALFSANLPGGKESYGVLPRGVSRYFSILNGEENQ